MSILQKLSIFKQACLVIVFCLVSSLASKTTAQTQIPYLQIVSDEEVTLVEIALEPSPTWMLRWNHSVTGILVTDYYYWNGVQMLLTDSHTPAFDAGLGHIPGRGRLESDGNNGYWIFDIDEPVVGNVYALRVGSKRVNHRIEHRGNIYSLSEVAENARVIIRVVVR